MDELYPHQDLSVAELRANLKRGVMRQILDMPTGSGKTHVSMNIFNKAQDKGSHCFFVCDRKALVFQAAERFTENGIEYGIAMSEHFQGRHRNIQIASVQTLKSRDFMTTGILQADGSFAERKVDLVVIDECHEIHKWILDYCRTRDIPVIGLTATALTEGLDQHYDAVVSVVTTEELTRDGYLAPLHVVSPKDKVDTDGLETNNKGEWSRTDVGERARVITGNVLQDWQDRTKEYFGGPVKTIVFCASIADGEETCEAFQAAGFNFGIVHNKRSDKENEQAIRAYKEGRIIGIVNVNMLARGFDSPSTLCVVDKATVRKALHVVIQRLGRVIRTSPGKKLGLYLDPADNIAGFHEELMFFFTQGIKSLKETKLRNATRKPKSGQAADMKCGSCGYVFMAPAKQCPACGSARPRPAVTTDEIPGDLEESLVLDGSRAGFTGNWWEEICAVVTKRHPKDKEKARRVALAKYRDIFKKWPPRGTEFEFVNREPHSVVSDTCYRYYQRWRIAQKKRAEKETA